MENAECLGGRREQATLVLARGVQRPKLIGLIRLHSQGEEPGLRNRLRSPMDYPRLQTSLHTVLVQDLTKEECPETCHSPTLLAALGLHVFPRTVTLRQDRAMRLMQS